MKRTPPAAYAAIERDAFAAPAAWALTAMESALVRLLMAREWLATREALAIFDAISGEARDPKRVVVTMCRLRAKLRCFGVFIEGVYAKGWRFCDETKAALRAGEHARPLRSKEMSL